MISRKMRTKILWGNFEKCFFEWEKMASRKIFRLFLHGNFFTFILLISNHTVFLFQFGIYLHLWVFQKAEIARAASASVISAFWKTLKCSQVFKGCGLLLSKCMWTGILRKCSEKFFLIISKKFVVTPKFLFDFQ